MGKKIGIITWHHYPNVGSALQAYALQIFLRENGFDAEFINYREYFRPKLKHLRSLLSRFDKVIPKFLSDKLNYRFIHFSSKYFHESKEIVCRKFLNEIAKQYDVVICGSDQIWASSVFNPVYFLNFVPSGIRKFSYAASLGLPKIPENLKRTYAELLKEFSAISVREEEGANLLKEIGIDAEVVCDPTLLLCAEHYEKISKYPKHKVGSYIFCYFLGTNSEHRRIAKEIARGNGKNLVIYSIYQSDKTLSDYWESAIGPSDFLGYIKSASLVLTDSFHGLLFSVIFKKNFYVFERFSNDDANNQNSRIYNILRILCIPKRLIREMPQKITTIDYSVVDKKRNIFVEHSKNFLLSNIK